MCHCKIRTGNVCFFYQENCFEVYFLVERRLTVHLSGYKSHLHVSSKVWNFIVWTLFLKIVLVGNPHLFIIEFEGFHTDGFLSCILFSHELPWGQLPTFLYCLECELGFHAFDHQFQIISCLIVPLYCDAVVRFKNTHCSGCCFPVSLHMQVCHFMTCRQCENNSRKTHYLAIGNTQIDNHVCIL